MKNEPAAVLSAILAVVIASVGLLTEFGVKISEGQQTAIITFVGAVGALVVGFLTRSLVTPVAKLQRESLKRRLNPKDLNSDGRDDKTGRFLPRT